MNIIIGSARADERGKIMGGIPGDQKQTTKPDYKGEVSMQNFYVHSKGWYILRATDPKIAKKIAKAMETACNNPNIGYDQTGRYGIVTNGTSSKVKTEADCSSTVRICVKEASGKDPGDFNTSTEVAVLQKTGLFEPTITYTTGTILYTGDILVTKTKGHTVIVTSGEPRTIAASNVPSSANPYQEPTKNIKAGSKGEGVKWVQWELNQSGANLKIDGEAGTKTINAVRQFQKKYKLEVDGIVGPATRTMMKKQK